MLTIEQTVDLEADAAHHKVALTRTPGLFLVRTMLAGAYIGIGVLIMLTAGGPLKQAGSPWAPLVQGLVFGVALTIVVVSSPLLIVGLVVGVAISLVQALTQIQEQTLVFVPKIIAIFVTLVLALPFMADALHAEMLRISSRIIGG